jgi:hypothetical protein
VQNQKNLELAYQDFLTQQGYPAEQVKFLASILSGIELPQTSITQRTDMPAMPGSASNVEKLLGGASGIDWLIETFKKYFPSGETSKEEKPKGS